MQEENHISFQGQNQNQNQNDLIQQQNNLIDESQPQNLQQEEEYQVYLDEDDQNDIEYDISQVKLDKRYSSDNNTQYEIAGLLHLIDKQVKKVQELTGFCQDWALVYYQTCGWKQQLVEKFIDQKGTNRNMIHYNAGKAKITNISGQCPICCLQQKIIYQNWCGDQFCQDCWKGQLIQRMNYHKDPFPPCLNEDCESRTAPYICNQIAKNDPAFKILYERTLCRSYARGSTSVKICKGRQKTNCDKCFYIKKIFELIQCETCGSFVCGRCGQQYHHPAQCYDGKNWREVSQDSSQFIQNLGYKICPHCKQGVQKKQACDTITCKCGKQFCYKCGQKWLPNHSQHGVCYRAAEMNKKREEILKKLQNQKQYTEKLQKYRTQLQSISSMIRRLQQVDTQTQKNNLISQFHVLSNQLHYLKQMKRKLVIGMLVWKNSKISQYFTQNLIMQSHCDNIRPLIDNAYDFLVSKIPNLLQAFNPQSVVTQKNVVQMRKTVKNPLEYLNQNKVQMRDIMSKIQKFIQC